MRDTEPIEKGFGGKRDAGYRIREKRPSIHKSFQKWRPSAVDGAAYSCYLFIKRDIVDYCCL
jgi:hypothetical protein